MAQPSPIRMLARRSSALACSSTKGHHRRIHLPLLSKARTALFGLSLPSLPVPSNEPLAGTGSGSAPFSWLFLLEVGLGLPLALWTYKCLMMVAFQRKIIYLPSVPPGSRNESLAEGGRSAQLNGLLSGMEWKQVTITSNAPSRWLRRPVALEGIELEWIAEKGSAKETSRGGRDQQTTKHTVIVYLQGNAGTPLLRLPLFRRLLQPSAPPLSRTAPQRDTSSLPVPSHISTPLPRLTLLAITPRSFWLSSRSAPTQPTILSDYRSTLKYITSTYPDSQIILYGHSLGGAATLLLLDDGAERLPALRQVVGAIIENPLPSIPYMVRALYPQRWLPYHWLGPAVFDRWDAKGVLARRAGGGAQGLLGRVPALWIRSGKDEIIPTDSEVKGEEGDGVQRMWADWTRIEEREKGGTMSRWVKVDGALHDTAFLDRRWREEVQAFVREVGK